MFGQSKRTTGIITSTAGRVSPYVDRLAHDEKLRRRLAAAISGDLAARRRAKRHRTGILGTVARISPNPALRGQLREAISQFEKARGRMQKTHSHKTRNSMLALAGAGLIVAAVPKLRSGLAHTLGGKSSGDDSGSGLDGSALEE
ncbi:MAG: hypothetical protein ACXVZW_11615 [Gaiellaceae bacterium]